MSPQRRSKDDMFQMVMTVDHVFVWILVCDLGPPSRFPIGILGEADAVGELGPPSWFSGEILGEAGEYLLSGKT